MCPLLLDGVRLACGPWLRVAEGVPDVVGATGAQTEVADRIPFDWRDAVFSKRSVEATLRTFLFGDFDFPSRVPESSLERDGIVQLVNHLYVAVFLIVAPCERSGGFGFPLHTRVDGWEGNKSVDTHRWPQGITLLKATDWKSLSGESPCGACVHSVPKPLLPSRHNSRL